MMGVEAPPPLDPVLTLDVRNLFRYRNIVYEKIDFPIFSFLNLKNSEKKVWVGVLVEKIMGRLGYGNHGYFFLALPISY